MKKLNKFGTRILSSHQGKQNTLHTCIYVLVSDIIKLIYISENKIKNTSDF